MDVHIDRLRLQLSGTDPDTARQFGRLVAERLGALLAGAPPAPGGAVRLAGLRVPALPSDGASPAQLASAVAAEISRQVTR